MVNTVNIFVRLIDGTEAFIPVKAIPRGDNQFQLQEFSEFDETDLSVLPQFIPGDVVLLTEVDSESGPIAVANELAVRSPHPAKSLYEFLYSAVTETLPLNVQTAVRYRTAIETIRDRIQRGSFIYPAVVATIDKLRELRDI